MALTIAHYSNAKVILVMVTSQCPVPLRDNSVLNMFDQLKQVSILEVEYITLET